MKRRKQEKQEKRKKEVKKVIEKIGENSEETTGTVHLITQSHFGYLATITRILTSITTFITRGVYRPRNAQ